MKLPLLDVDSTTARAAVDWLLAQAEREYIPSQFAVGKYPDDPRSPGWFNNRDSVGNALLAFWIMDDDIALRSAQSILNWLVEKQALWDRAHCHRLKWLAAVSTFEHAAVEWMRRLSADPYLNGNLAGATLRPLVRAIGEAAALAKLMGDKISTTLAGATRTTLDVWLKRLWEPSKNATWGWTKHDDPEPLIFDFPYMDGRDRWSMASNTTWFIAGSVTPYEMLLCDLCLDLDEDARRLLRRRARTLCRHALLWGYDPGSGMNLKAIGFDKPEGEDDMGCYAPGFMDMEFRTKEDSFIDEKGEPGYHDLSPAFVAASPGSARPLINWLRKGARALTPGELPLGLVYAALHYHRREAER